MDADFLAFSGHKMLGPSGVGVLYGKRELLEAMPPFLGGGGMIRRVLPDRFEPADLPQKFEAGTPPIVSAVALGTAIKYLDAVGFDAIARHERRLTQRAHEILQGIEGVRILGPAPSQKAGIVGFTLSRVHAHDVAEVLDRSRHCDPRRASLCHAAAPALRRGRDGPGELLFLQHAGRGRAAWPRLGAGQADLSSQADVVKGEGGGRKAEGTTHPTPAGCARRELSTLGSRRGRVV